MVIASPDDDAVMARIKASIERDMADPEWVAQMRGSLDDAVAGRILPMSIAMLPLPRWTFYVLYHWVAPWTWGRRMRTVARKAIPPTTPTSSASADANE